MSDDITSDGKTTHDEKSSTSGKLESMSKEELIKIVKNQILLKKKLDLKINELTTSSNTNSIQIEEVINQLRKQYDDEQSKYSTLVIEFDKNKLYQKKIEEELNSTRELLEHFQRENQTLKTSCQNLQDEISNLQSKISMARSSISDECQKSLSHSELLSKFISTTIDLLQIPISSSNSFDDDFFQIYKNELEQKQEHSKQLLEQLEEEKLHLQQRIEDYEFLNEEIKLEMDDLRLKSVNYEKDKKLMEKEIDNYRRQVEDFEEQFLELQRESHCNHLQTCEYSSRQSSVLTINQIDDNLDEAIVQCLDFILNQIDSNNQQISKASSTSSLLITSDIPTLLHSIGITNCTDEDFSVPLNFESVLRLSTLLIERCRVLQYILLKNNNTSMDSVNVVDYDKDCILFLQNNDFEQCKIFVHKHDHIVLDTLFERIYTGMNQTMKSDEWHIVIEKPTNQKFPSGLRIQFDNFKFVSEEVEQNLTRLRSRYDQLVKENEEQQNKISLLEKRLYSNNSYEQLKEHQAQLEEKLAKQCEKTIELESILKHDNIDKAKLDQLKHIELSYNELQQKYHIAEHLEEQLKQLNENLSEKDLTLKQQQDLYDELKNDYDHQHSQLLERDENIRLLKIELEHNEKSKETLIEKYQSQITQFLVDLEQQKLSLLNAAQNQDELNSLKLKENNELSDLIQIKINENKQLIEKNILLDKDLKRSHEIILEKNQKLDLYQNELKVLKMKYQEITIEKDKLTNEVNELMNEIIEWKKEKSELIQNIDTLKQSLETHHKAIDQENIQLQQTSENLKNESEFNKVSLQNVQLKQSVNNSELRQTNVIDHPETELNSIQKENEKHNQNLNDKNDKNIKSNSDSVENIQELKEKYQKMKMLLTRLKKELHEKNQHLPKQSLIDLELADYEKTIQNLKDELMNKDKEIQDLNEELSNSTDKYTCLKIENKNLEQQNQQIEQRANKFKALLELAKKELQNAKDLELQRNYNDDHVRVLIENFQNDSDNNKILITELQKEKQHLLEKVNNQNETSQRTINLLEQNLSILKHDLDVAKQDYDTLQDDFNSYKIRAQSVLKQHQMNQRERTPSVADKQVELEETIEKLNTTLREANNKIQLLISENDMLQKEQDGLIELQAKLINESKKREQDIRKQHKLDIESIENEYLQRINDSDDKFKNVTLLNETLSAAFKEQLAIIESENKHSISILQKELKAAQQELDQYKIRIELLQQTNIDNEKLTSNSESSQIGINNYFDRDDTLACSTSERQHGEESELANTNDLSSNIAIKTCDNCLISNNSIIENNTPTSNTNISSLPNDKSRDISLEQNQFERQCLEDELHKTKICLLETTELLNESEINNQRLNEQVTLLKDEIRRIERNMDRAESISNLEYLKNVIVKFFILKSTDERLQLIPVLVTMLKLSPDEQAQLVRVANLSTTFDENLRSNELPTQQMTNNDVNSPSWSSYLNIW